MSALGSAVRGYRLLGPHESITLVMVAILAIATGVVAFLWPRALAYPVGVLSGLAAITMLARAWRARR